MNDIHCHILPGMDDGPENIETSINMARAAVKEGITTIIATPHHKNNKFENTKNDIKEQVKEFNNILKKENISLKILPGQEVRIYGEILQDYKKGEILTLAETQYLFIEFPSDHVPAYAAQLLFDIQLKGLIPIIVHPERNKEIMEKPDLLYQLVKKGVLTQVTASSVAGYFGKKVQKFSHQLIEANLTHFVASDAHNVHNRSFNLIEAYDVIESKFGVDMFYLYSENSELLIDNLNVYKEIPEKVKKKKFLGIF